MHKKWTFYTKNTPTESAMRIRFLLKKHVMKGYTSMRKFQSVHRVVTDVLVLMLLTGCTAGGITPQAAVSAAVIEDVSHSGDSLPDYEIVFPQEKVNRIDITLSAEAWADLQAEMTDQFGTFGEGSQDRGLMQGGNGQGFPGGGQPPEGFDPQEGWSENMPTPVGLPDDEELPEGFQFPQGGDLQFPGGRPGGGMGGMNFGDTSYVKSTVTFNGETWEDVGFRYSGNSTQQTSWSSGTLKISFRLDFDEFEDENPAIEDQRFYGFKQISFKSNAMDDSYIREKVTADLFREAGVVSSQTAFYEVYIDSGEGSQYYGVYTAVEIVDDTVVETQFADGSGNVYKPEGSGANFTAGTFSKDGFEKQTNADEADWSDIEAVFEALHSDLRQGDPAEWRAELEAVFDVDAFLHWLAADTVIQNWDTYGSMAHNYYLYTDPADGLVTWIPWDNNMALSGSGGMQGGADRGGGGIARGRGGARELDITTVSDQWPLISYLAADEVYLAKYQQYLQDFTDTVWQPEELTVRYQKYHDLIAPYVEKEEEGFTQLESVEVFDEAIETLKEHAQERYDAVEEYLAAE